MRDFKQNSIKSSETKKIRKILSEEMRLGINASSDSENDDVDLRKEIHPLSHYINDREEMIEQMFSVIRGGKLKKMLPTVLKDMQIDEQKADCLIHLLGMSKKRILSIIEGKETNSSSDSETSSDSSVLPKKKKEVDVKPIIIKQEGCSDISDNSEEVVLIDPDCKLSNKSSNKTESGESFRKSKKRRKEHKSKNLDDKSKKIKKNKLSHNKLVEIEETTGSNESTGSENEKVTLPGKNLLEILELEMRARAIRALLQKSGTTEIEDNDENNIPSVVSKENVNEWETTKITPAKNFRKKKQTNDDVIVITPTLVTIDLTDETDPANVKSTTKNTNLKFNNLQEDVNKEYNIHHKTDIMIAHSSSNVVNASDNNKISGEHSKTIALEISDKNSSIQERNDNVKSNENQHKSNWAQRWLESKEVKKVVSTSKICGNIRKRIKRAKLAQQFQDQSNPDSGSSSPSVEKQEILGSVGEYQSLPKSNKSFDISSSISSDNNLQSSNYLPEKINKIEELKENESSVEQVQDVTSTKTELPKETLLFESDNSNEKLVQSTKVNQELTSEYINECKSIATDSISSNVLNCASVNDLAVSDNKTEEILLPKAESCQIFTESLNAAEEISNEPFSHISDNTKNDIAESAVNNSTTNMDEIKTKSKNDKNVEDFGYEEHQGTSEDIVDTVLSSNFKFNRTKEHLDTSNQLRVELDTKDIETTHTENINEPETLEINITDEDREIDRMMDEKHDSLN